MPRPGVSATRARRRPSGFFRGRNIDRQRDSNEAGLSGARLDDFQCAVVRLDDFAADGEAEAETHVSRREERRRRLLRGLRREARAVVLHFDLQSVNAVAVGILVQPDADLGIRRIGLERVENHFGQRVLFGAYPICSV